MIADYCYIFNHKNAKSLHNRKKQNKNKQIIIKGGGV